MSHSSWAALRLLVAVAMLGWRWVPREWIPRGVDRLRWALGCDEIENLDRLLSRDDTEQTDQGYYNQLLDTGLEPDLSPPICQAVAELREVVLMPNLSIVRANGTTWSTNALGMRDRPYAVSKPAGTFRIAMTGDSIGVGLGVSDGRGFEPALEQWLAEQSRRRGGPAVEILNFALPGRSPGQRWDHFQKVGWAMKPDLVLFEATAADVGWDQRRLAELLPRGIGWDSALYGDILKRSGVRPGATSEDYAQALRPYRWELLAAVYRAVAADCRARGVPCLWVLIPRVGRVVEPAEHRRLARPGPGRGVHGGRGHLGCLRRLRSGRPGDPPQRLPPQRRGPRPAGPPARPGAVAAARAAAAPRTEARTHPYREPGDRGE